MKQLQVAYEVSERRACRVLCVFRSTQRYQSVADDRAELWIRLRDLAAVRVRYGYRRLHILIQREGWQVNHKLVYRLYREEGLGIRRKTPRRRKSVQIRQERELAQAPDESWSMDFMADQLYSGERFRLLTIVDNFSRESLAIRVGQRLTGDQVVEVLAQLAEQRRTPQSIRVDNGPEFISKSLDWWAYWNRVKLDFSRPGKPTDNALIESFNGKFRAECLNQHWFLSLEDAQAKVDAWRYDYNDHRPHSALGQQSPSAFAQRASSSASARARQNGAREAPIEGTIKNSHSKWTKLGGKVTVTGAPTSVSRFLPVTLVNPLGLPLVEDAVTHGGPLRACGLRAATLKWRAPLLGVSC